MENAIEQWDDSVVLDATALAAGLILENGGETFRAEETAVRICCAGNYNESEIVALTTGIFITLVKGETSYKTRVRRIRRRAVDLRVLDAVNTISRDLSSGSIDFKAALKMLAELQKKKHRCFHLLRYSAYSAFACAIFTLVYGGGIFDCAVAFVCGALLQVLSSSFSKINIYPLATAFFGSAMVSVIATLSHTLLGMGSVEKIMVGAIIPLLPGLATTNAIRDTIMGDLISGSARFTDRKSVV